MSPIRTIAAPFAAAAAVLDEEAELEDAEDIPDVKDAIALHIQAAEVRLLTIVMLLGTPR